MTTETRSSEGSTADPGRNARDAQRGPRRKGPSCGADKDVLAPEILMEVMAAPAAAGATEVGDRRRELAPDGETGGSVAAAEVDVLEVHPVRRVEPAQSHEVVTPEEHRDARDPVRVRYVGWPTIAA